MLAGGDRAARVRDRVAAGRRLLRLARRLPPVAIIPPGQSPLDDPTKLVLPVATLLLASLAAGIRMVRAGMVEVLQTEYVQTARLNGLAEKRVLLRYALRNSLAPSVQVLAQNLQWLIGGIIITETIFAYPGHRVAAGDRGRKPRHDAWCSRWR